MQFKLCPKLFNSKVGLFLYLNCYLTCPVKYLKSPSDTLHCKKASRKKNKADIALRNKFNKFFDNADDKSNNSHELTL